MVPGMPLLQGDKPGQACGGAGAASATDRLIENNLIHIRTPCSMRRAKRDCVTKAYKGCYSNKMNTMFHFIKYY
jgi:hypothetical protein